MLTPTELRQYYIIHPLSPKFKSCLEASDRILTHDVFVDGSADLLLDLSLRVPAGVFVAPPQVDVAVGRREGEGEQTDDEQITQKPKIRRDLK